MLFITKQIEGIIRGGFTQKKGILKGNNFSIFVFESNYLFICSIS